MKAVGGGTVTTLLIIAISAGSLSLVVTAAFMAGARSASRKELEEEEDKETIDDMATVDHKKCKNMISAERKGRIKAEQLLRQKVFERISAPEVFCACALTLKPHSFINSFIHLFMIKGWLSIAHGWYSEIAIY